MIVLLILLVLNLFVFTSLASSQCALKMTATKVQRTQLFYAAEHGLSYAEKRLHDLHCLLPRASSNEYAERNVDWWKSSATCHLNDSHYLIRYVIERLEFASCSRFINSHLVPRYYRITSYSNVLSGDFPIKLQSTYAIPEKSSVNCDGKSLTTIIEGRQSWREL